VKRLPMDDELATHLVPCRTSQVTIACKCHVQKLTRHVSFPYWLQWLCRAVSALMLVSAARCC
jgi:hypothetical protein